MAKICTVCKQEKSEDDFYKKSNGRLHAECKSCFNDRRMKSYYSKQDKVNQIENYMLE